MAKDTSQSVWGKCVIANDVAIAQVMTLIDGDWVDASGVSRKHPDDKFSASVAEKLAYGRALESLGKKLQKRANGEVKQNEDNLRRKRKASGWSIPEGNAPEIIAVQETAIKQVKKHGLKSKKGAGSKKS